MNMNSQFVSTDVDETSLIPTAHFSYVVEQLLPVRLVGRHRFEQFDREYAEHVTIEDEDTIMFPVGSQAEALNIPSTIIRKSGEEVRGGDYTDLDVMIIMLKHPVTFDPAKMISDEYDAYVETENVHPGYARLNTSQHSEIPVYKNREQIQLKMFMTIQSDERTKNPEKMDVNGPAITFLSDPLTKSNYKDADKTPSSDNVLALPCKEWPPVAMDWIDRSRDRKWLSDDLIDSVVQNGCHIVPTCHRLSLQPQIEWRLSFAAIEKRIAREVVTDKQRQAYVFLKLLYHQRIKEKTIITSYHLKTVFFYACECIPPAEWDNNLGSCIFAMIDMLIECIVKKNLPNFFIPQNNLIDYLTNEDIICMEDILKNIRRNPIACIVDFTDDKLIGKASVRRTFRELMDPILNDMPKYTQHRDRKRSCLEAFVPTTYKILLTQLEERKNEEAVHVAKDLHSLLVHQQLSEETFGEFCFWNIAVHMTDGRMSVSFLEQAVAMHEGDPDFDCCRDNLPCLYHAASYRVENSPDQRRDYLTKADAGFLSCFARKGVAGGYIDYAHFLIKQTRYDDAITWIDRVINTNDLKMANSYDASEIMTLDEVLQHEVIEHNTISAPSVSFAFYLKVYCLLRKTDDMSDSITEVMNSFKKHADDLKLPRTYALLGYTYMSLKNWKEASNSFALAATLNKGQEYTRALKMKKFCDEQIG